MQGELPETMEVPLIAVLGAVLIIIKPVKLQSIIGEMVGFPAASGSLITKVGVKQVIV
jgi:hypothetical protein